MSTLAAQIPPPHPGEYAIGENRRISATLVLSVLVHAMLLLGVGWAVESAAPVMPTLDVILTETTSPLTQEAGRLPRPGHQPGRRRARQDHAARAKPSPAPPRSPNPASRRDGCGRSRRHRSRRRRTG